MFLPASCRYVVCRCIAGDIVYGPVCRHVFGRPADDDGEFGLVIDLGRIDARWWNDDGIFGGIECCRIFKKRTG